MAARRHIPTACRTCGQPFERCELRESPVTVREGFLDHVHRGRATWRYGICARHHWNRLDRVGVEWSVCAPCVQRERKMRCMRRQQQQQQQRVEHARIPSFLREELDNFIAKRVEQCVEQSLERWAALVPTPTSLRRPARSLTPPPRPCYALSSSASHASHASPPPPPPPSPFV